jgi:integrase
VGGLSRRGIARWRTHVGQTKTDTSRSAVPVILLLSDILEQHRQTAGTSRNGYIFAGEKQGRPLHLDNLSRCVIIDIIGERWHGWHAFRRGLGTNLHKLGVQPEVIQRILRHANVSTIQASYIVVSSECQKAAMNEFSRVVDSKWTIKPRKTANEPTKPR